MDCGVSLDLAVWIVPGITHHGIVDVAIESLLPHQTVIKVLEKLDWSGLVKDGVLACLAS